MSIDKIKFGITYFGAEHPEMEIGRRIKVAADNIGVECYFINHFCKDINTGEDAEKLGLDFFLVFDPCHEVIFETYYYHLNWFPRGLIPGHLLTKYNSLSKACNDQLVFPASKVENIFLNKGVSFSKDYLFPSVPHNYVIKPILFEKGNYKLFYAGLSSGRHAELFANLDTLDIMKFYGPEKINGKRVVHNLKSYSGEIPFDGKSMIDVSSKCGITLAIQDDLHKESGVCTNRIFEGLAAGNIVIADKMEFVEKHFKNTVFMLNAHLTLEEKTNEIIRIVKWANENPEDALKMATKAQEIFLEKFELTKVLSALCEGHFKRKAEVLESSLQKAKNKSVTIVIEEISSQNDLQVQIENILKQDYNNIQILAIEDESSLFWEEGLLKLKEKFPLEILKKQKQDISFNDNPKFNLLSFIKGNIKTEAFCFSASNEYWLCNHIRELAVKIEEDQSYVSYADIYVRKEGQRSYILNNIAEIPSMLLSPFVSVTTALSNHLYHLLQTTFLKSSCLFKTEVFNLLKENEINSLYAYQHTGLILACYLNNKSISCSEKLTTFLKSDFKYDAHKINNVSSTGSLAFVLQNAFSGNFNIQDKIQNARLLSSMINPAVEHNEPQKRKKYYKRINRAYVGMICSTILNIIFLIIIIIFKQF